LVVVDKEGKREEKRRREEEENQPTATHKRGCSERESSEEKVHSYLLYLNQCGNTGQKLRISLRF